LVLLVAVFVTQCGGGGDAVASSYAKAWQRQDFAQMYSMLSGESKRQISLERFAQLQRNALATATVRSLTPGQAGDWSDGKVTVPFTVDTRAFGSFKAPAEIPLTDDDSEAKVVWSESLLLPGLRKGDSLARSTTMPPRADLLAADGTPLAQGPNRVSAVPDVSAEIAGTVGQPPDASASGPSPFGYPAGTAVGLTGLERAFQERLAGTPGGTLSASGRVLARTSPIAAKPLRTTIVPEIERAAATALAGRAGGVAVVVPQTGAILAAAGSAFSSTAPPGSTFKIITASAALESGSATPESTYPYASAASLDGRMLQNAGGEVCGGTLVQAFADSCNSVFAPIGVKVGAERLVAMAEKYGFNKPIAGIPNAAISPIPQAESMQGEDAVGTTAIGQGQVEASTLEMTTTAATVANGGVRAEPTLIAGAAPKTSRVTSRKTALDMRRLMLAVVKFGTGTSAAISGVPVAGKTGTAELVDTTSPDVQAGDPRNTDAWFVAFAPAFKPRFAVGVELDGAGHGGDTAAPAAHDVLVAALSRR
jgi:cell division protein FtsI/penicillin-binding protein 2